MSDMLVQHWWGRFVFSSLCLLLDFCCLDVWMDDESRQGSVRIEAAAPPSKREPWIFACKQGTGRTIFCMWVGSEQSVASLKTLVVSREPKPHKSKKVRCDERESERPKSSRARADILSTTELSYCLSLAFGSLGSSPWRRLRFHLVVASTTHPRILIR